MRLLVTLLVVANLALLAWSQLYPSGADPVDRRGQQIQPDALKPFTPAQVKAMALDKPVAHVVPSCIEWGPFAESEAARAQAALEKIAEGRNITPRAIEVTTAYWVFIPPQSGKPAADKKLLELKSLGVGEMYLVQESGPQKFAISLGLFRSEEAANAHLANVHQLGVKTARIAPRTQTLSQTLLVVRDALPETLARVQELKLQFPGAEAKQMACNGKPAL